MSSTNRVCIYLILFVWIPSFLLVFYRCIPDVLSKTIDSLNIFDTDDKKINSSDISTGMK